MIKKVSKLTRIDIDEYFLKIASVVAERSTCRRHHIGAVAVRDKRILATGYNGAPSGTKDCLELGCMRDDQNIPSGERHEICRAIHAEQNVIIQAGLHGVSLDGATVYCTHTPCILCAKMLVNAKIKCFISYSQYNPSSYDSFITLKAFGPLFQEAGIQSDVKERPSAKITFLD
jgi:dCMP deaminase